MNTLFSVIALAILAVTFVSAFGMWWGIAATLAVVLVFAVLRRRTPPPKRCLKATARAASRAT